jgi:hypothetical protein
VSRKEDFTVLDLEAVSAWWQRILKDISVSSSLLSTGQLPVNDLLAYKI